MIKPRKLNIDNGSQDWKIEHQSVSGGMFYCQDSADFSVFASKLNISSLDGN